MTRIVSTRIRHRVVFAPDPVNPAFPTKPKFVETRLIRDLTEFPKGAHYTHFEDVIETLIRLPDGRERTVYSEPVNDQVFLVQWDEVSHRQVLNNSWPGAIEVHPSLKGKVWIVASEHRELEEQNAA